MLTYPQINPVAIHLGPLSVHWYGLMYLAGFFIGWWLLARRARDARWGFTQEQVSDILFYTALGVIIGGRLGYMFFYDWPDLRDNPWFIFQVWKGGMSFHGGLIGVIIALACYARSIQHSVVRIADFIAPVVPVGLGLGRIGNFINGELWGRVTTVPWGMVFPNGGPLPRHPSQLYEFFFEGIILFLILWIYSAKPRPLGATSGLFLIGYGAIRFSLEFFREPDQQIGYIAWGWLTKGQLLSFPMMLIGILIMSWAYWSNKRCNNI